MLPAGLGEDSHLQPGACPWTQPAEGEGYGRFKDILRRCAGCMATQGGQCAEEGYAQLEDSCKGPQVSIVRSDWNCQ